MQIGYSWSFLRFRRDFAVRVRFIYKVLLANKVYLRVLYVSVKNTNKKHKEENECGKQSSKVQKMTGEKKPINLCLNISLPFACRCLVECMFSCVRRSSVSHPESVFACANRCFPSLVLQRSDPSIFLPFHSPPLLPFREHLFFGAMWVTPASQRRHRRIRSPYKVLAIRAGFVREARWPLVSVLTPPSENSGKGQRGRV